MITPSSVSGLYMLRSSAPSEPPPSPAPAPVADDATEIVFRARIAKVRDRDDHEVILHGVASDTAPDMYRTRMSTRLYRSFIRRANERRPPYISIAHYRYPVGVVEGLGVDGEYLKFRAVLDRRNPILEHLIARLDDQEFRSSLAFSIGFDDYDRYRDAMADNILVYTDGFLDHIAITSIPANPRSRLLGVEMRASTQFADAEYLVGKTFASYLYTMANRNAVLEATKREGR